MKNLEQDASRFFIFHFSFYISHFPFLTSIIIAMKRRILSIVILGILFSNLSAQKLTGKVTDGSNNTPLAGATVTTNKGGTITNHDGVFSLECNKATSISVSFIGYQSVKMPVTNCNQQINIVLTRSNQNLNDVEITATSNLNKSILYQPNSITKISLPELKRGTGLFLDDAINGNIPGVTMNRRAVSSGQQFNIRGYGNGSRGTRGISSNFDGQGYKVYLNNIPVTDAEGISVLDDIDYGSIGSVEVVKGPSGTLFGLAIAGVVNLHTIRPEKGRTSVGQEVLVGNYGLQRYTTQFQMGGERSSILVNYGHQKSDGFTVHNASHKDFVNVVGEFQPNTKQSVSAYFGYSNSYDQRSGELTIAQYTNDDFSGNPEYIKRNAHSQVYTVRTGMSHTYNFSDHVANTTTVFGTAFNSNASSAGGWTDKATTNLGLRSTFDTKFSMGTSNLSGITGVETQRQNASTIGYGMIDPLGSTHVWAMGDPYFIIGSNATGSNGITSDLYAATATTSLFTEWTLALPQDFSVTAGFGLSNMKITLDDRFYVANKPTHFDTLYKWMVSPHVAINKVFSKQFSAYASYNRAFKAPVSSYFYIPYAVISGSPVAGTGKINSGLVPEKGDQFEIGTKGALLSGKLTYQLAYFNIKYNNKITNVNVLLNPTTTAYSYVVNGGKQTNQGVESLLKYTVYSSADGFFKAVTPFANLTYSNFKYGDFPFHLQGTVQKDSIVNYNGNAVAGVAKVMANVGFDVSTKPGLYANMTYLYKDPVPITSDGKNISPKYHLLNAKIGFQRSLSNHFDLNVYFGVNNIEGNKYPIMIFVNQIPDAYIAGPRRANSYGGVSVKYTL